MTLKFKSMNQSKRKWLFDFENYLNDDGVFIDALNDDTALQFNHSILLLQSVNASR
jgi:hypothetical protein